MLVSCIGCALIKILSQNVPFFSGPLCGQCAENYSVTLDLQECAENPCDSGLPVFILLCK